MCGNRSLIKKLAMLLVQNHCWEKDQSFKHSVSLRTMQLCSMSALLTTKLQNEKLVVAMKVFNFIYKQKFAYYAYSVRAFYTKLKVLFNFRWYCQQQQPPVKLPIWLNINWIQSFSINFFHFFSLFCKLSIIIAWFLILKKTLTFLTLQQQTLLLTDFATQY